MNPPKLELEIESWISNKRDIKYFENIEHVYKAVRTKSHIHNSNTTYISLTNTFVCQNTQVLKTLYNKFKRKKSTRNIYIC
jgi:hypothetical protein